jgi:hypothetical protein
MVQRLSFELMERPRVADGSEAKTGEIAKRLSVTVGKAAIGEATT